jgi:hypothetical protein
MFTEIAATLLPLVLASASGAFDLSWWSVDGGGDRSTGGEFILQGTAGQPDPGLLHGGDFSLAGGLWGGAEMTLPLRRVYLPVLVS